MEKFFFCIFKIHNTICILQLTQPSIRVLFVILFYIRSVPRGWLNGLCAFEWELCRWLWVHCMDINVDGNSNLMSNKSGSVYGTREYVAVIVL